MAAPAKSINLLTAEIKPQGQWDRIYAWTANTAKYIIILTEIVVLGAIAYRFVLDGKIAKVNDEIVAQKQLLEARATEETDMRLFLTNINSIKNMQDSTYSLAAYYAQIMQLIPTAVDIRNVSIDINNSSLSGQVGSYDTLLQLENNLKGATGIISGVSMSANQSSGSGINFSVSFKIRLGE
jgi:Tfp pilus assembly protein PilO